MLWKKYTKDARLRFLAAGGSSAMLSWLVRFPLNTLMSYPQAVILATAISMIYSFVLYRAWVFPGSDRSLRQQVRDFAVVNLFAMIVTLAVAVLLAGLFDQVGIARTAAQAMAHAIGIAVAAVLNYLGHRRITFRHD